ncbi:CidA/LrgA family protein [Amphibiibacter pelophylacis]|uniref:CidA/LrgA family protein n=1 Tax=Amphibiibacter pelophylacis TaxID=1799477 RepID=A0ACC6P0H7_9BURK
MIAALALLLGFQLVGEALVVALGWSVPGPVIGMLLLLAVLVWRGGPGEDLRQVSGTLLQHLSLLFVPAGAGVLVHAHLLGQDAGIIAAALLGSTVLSLVVTAGVFGWLSRRRKPARRPQAGDPAP